MFNAHDAFELSHERRSKDKLTHTGTEVNKKPFRRHAVGAHYLGVDGREHLVLLLTIGGK